MIERNGLSAFADRKQQEELNEISLRTANSALAFAFSKSKKVRQKLQNVKSTEDISEKVD